MSSAYMLGRELQFMEISFEAEPVINGIARNNQWKNPYPSQSVKYEVKELIKKNNQLLWMLAYINTGLSF